MQRRRLRIDLRRSAESDATLAVSRSLASRMARLREPTHRQAGDFAVITTLKSRMCTAAEKTNAPAHQAKGFVMP